MSELINRKVKLGVEQVKARLRGHFGVLTDIENRAVADFERGYRAQLQLEENKRRAKAEKHRQTLDMFDEDCP